MTNADVTRVLGANATDAYERIMRLSHDHEGMSAAQVEEQILAIVRNAGHESSGHVSQLAARIVAGYRGAELFAF